MTRIKECWATVASNATEAIKALVIAKNLRRLMTSRHLLLFASPDLPEPIWNLIHSEFDAVIRLDKQRIDRGVHPHTLARITAFSLKWQRIVFLAPNAFVVQACDDIFKIKKNAFSQGFEIGVIQPSTQIWRKLDENLKNDVLDEAKLFDGVFGSELLPEKFCVEMNLQNGMMRNVKDIMIVRFHGLHPLEAVSKTVKPFEGDMLTSGIFRIWKETLDMLLNQYPVFENVEFNGLKQYWMNVKNAKMAEMTDQTSEIQDSIAIVGMSFRFPGANNVDEFWKLLIEGRDAIRTAPEGRWNAERTPCPNDEAKKSRAGFLNVPVDEFDGKFFGISPMELEFMDPQQRLTLQVAWEALEDAGINPTSLNRTYTGVYGGEWRTDYREALQTAGAGEAEFFRCYLGNSVGVLTARISHCLGLTGPAVTTESGCSSSMVAVDLACKSLLRRETDLSLACGVNLLIHPFTGKTMNTVLSPTGQCKTFSEDADGFGRAEGCAVLVLKRYADAMRDGDRVWSLIRGTAVVQEGASKSLGTPTKYCEALAMQMALDEARVLAKDVSYVETHGTGTPVGDPLEVAAVGQVYGEDREDKLTIGSVKTNIGHTESCSGIAGIIKVALSMQHEMIPAHLNLKSLNPAINLDSIPAQIPLKAMEWKRDPRKPRIAGVSSFGITGTDAHAILQETPDIPYPRIVLSDNVPHRRPQHVLAISGKTEEALDQSISDFQQFLETTSERVEDICHTSVIGRAHFPHRAVIVGQNKQEFLEKLKANNIIKGEGVPEETPKVCFLFTGQGSQYPGMAKGLYNHSPGFKMYFDQCDELLRKEYGIEIKDALWGNNTADLSRTIYSQTSIFVMEYCLLQLWESWGVKPDFVLGHSLGEFAAAVGGGILSFEGALKLVAERSRLIDALPRGKMMVLKENKEQTDILLKAAFEGSKGWLDYAAVNSPEQTVVAGSEENIQHFADFCKNNKIKTHVLDATHAFHSRHMDPILDEYKAIANTVTYSKPRCVYVSGMEGRAVDGSDGLEIDSDYWVRHTRDSVRFAAASKAVMSNGCTVFLEVGPQPVLSALTMINSDDVTLSEPIKCLPSIRKQEENWSCILNTVAKLHTLGVNIDWTSFNQYEGLKKCSAPFYPFQNKTFWFEIPDTGPGQIHPLVGTPVSNASGLKIFQNKLDLEDTNNTFLKDHVIGNKIIFPGAGYLECALVAAHSATQCTELAYFPPSAPVTISNFQIEAPLGLAENEYAQLQVIVSTEESGDTRVTVYSKLVLDKETQKWIRHASALFHPYAVQSKEDEFEINLEEILKEFKEPTELSEMYGKLAEFGLKFGTTFRTLKRILRKSSDQNDNLLFEVAITQDPEKFICHPVITDALFQAIMFAANPSDQKLHVPVSVQKFIVFSPIPKDAESCYVFCSKAENGDIKAALLDSTGVKLAQMEGAILMETSVETIMSVLQAQKLSLPAMYEDVWRSQTGLLEKRANLEEVFNYSEVSSPSAVEDFIKRFNTLEISETEFNKQLDHLCALYMIKCLYDIDFAPSLVHGLEFSVKEVMTRFKILPGLEGFMRFVFFELEKDGYFVANATSGPSNLTFQMVKSMPHLPVVNKEIETLGTLLKSQSPSEIDYISSSGRNISAIITGKESALNILFPEDTGSSTSAEAFYMTSKMSQKGTAFLEDFLPRFFQNAPNTLEETKTTVRILEVGAGTASFTRTLVSHLQGQGTNWEYTFTDLSPIFFANGKKVFEGKEFKVHYKVLNIEEDPTTQGFVPGQFDMIVANLVIHATKSIPTACLHLRNLLREGGTMFISESTVPVRSSNIAFGLLDAYWHYEAQDFGLRGYNCEISAEKWAQVLHSVQFSDFIHYPLYGDRISLMSARKVDGPLSIPGPISSDKIWWVFAEEEGSVTKFVVDYMASTGHKMVIINRGTEYKKTDEFHVQIRANEESDMSQVMKYSSEELGMKFEGAIFLWGLDAHKYEDMWEGAEFCCQSFLHLCKSLIALDHPKLFVVTKSTLTLGDQEVSPPSPSPLWAMAKCFQNEQPGAVTRCIDLDDSQEITSDHLLELCSEFLTDDGEIYVAYRGHQRNVPRFISWKAQQNNVLNFPKTEKFRLILPPSNAISDLRYGAFNTKVALQNGQVEARVKSYALNFRDVFAVLKPSPEFESMNTVGIDWSGIVTAVGPNVVKYKVGDAIFSTNLNGDALPSHVIVHEDIAMAVPESLSFNEAATLPAVAATAYLCLVAVAKLTKEDTILIHTASGGVGLVAIQIARAVGATMVATAGNKRKRAFLRDLGVHHVFHSRNTNYEHEVREALGGRGVDVVLNSLTGTGFKEASLALCNHGARFIEMSKLSTWTVEEVKALRPDVDYRIVDLSASSEEEMRGHMRGIAEFLEKDIIHPIPYCRFDASEIREALTYLQHAKHIGKIIVTMPDPEQNGIEPLFNERSTYLITGGLGGIGMEVAKWMVQVGAVHIALVGRSPPNDKAKDEIKRMNQHGKNVFDIQCDVGDEIQCKALLEQLQSPELGLPPLRGVMHAAGVLSDAIYNNQSWEKYCRTYNPKVRGGWNLHKLTLNLPLEHFVMFSSGVASFGSMGQSNHASANFFLDSLAAYRHFKGLPATTINWGQWGEVGVAANIEIIGLRPFTVLQGISALERVMKSQKLQACVCEADFNVIKQVFSASRRYIEELKLNQTESKELQINKEQFWNDYDAAKDDEGRMEVVRRFLRSMIRHILKLAKEEKLNDDENFQDMGMDSLMSIELANVLKTTVGSRATITHQALKDCHTINQLASRLCQLLSGDNDDNVPVPTAEELKELIREDSILSESIMAAEIAPCKFSQVKNVFMTGVTGNMGPYFLRDISIRSHVSKIYCIVREETGNISADERLKNTLQSKGLLQEVDMSKVEIVRGHLNRPKLGLSDEVYDELAENVDCIVHLAVKSNLTDAYKKLDKPDSTDIRTVNVKGTKNILEFACQKKTKLILHASTIVANAQLSKDFTLDENWPGEDDFDQMPNSAYPISKYVCDRLMAQAVTKGIPVKAFRFPAVGGDSKSGSNVNYENNQLMLRMMSYLHLGMMPAVPIPYFILPVDICTSLATRVFFDDNISSDIFNVYNPYPNSETEVVHVAEELGYHVEILDPDLFQDRIAAKTDNKLIHFLKEACENKDAQNRFHKDSPAIMTAYTRNPNQAFMSKKLCKFLPDIYPKEIENTISVIRRDLKFAKESGIFQKFDM